MKRKVFLLTLLGLAACNPRPFSALDSEAFDEARAYFSKCFTQCGDTWTGRHQSGTQIEYIQLRDPVFFAKATDKGDVSESDKRLGVEWNGTTWVMGKGYRIYSNNRWSQWSGGMPSNNRAIFFPVQKIKGKWEFREPYYSPVKCEEIPQ